MFDRGRSSEALLFVVFLAAGATRCAPRAEPGDRLVWVDRAGRIVGTLGPTFDLLSDVAVSPDGRRVAVRGRREGNDDIYLLDASGSVVRLTFDEAHARHPAWSPTGERIAFFSFRDGQADLFVRDVHGGESYDVLVSGPEHEYSPDWTPDGRSIVFHVHDRTTDRRDLYVAHLDEDGGRPRPLLETEADEALPRVSPDGRWVAYQGDATGRWEVYVLSLPGAERSLRVSRNGGVWPKWSRDGEELFYFEEDTLMAVPVVSTTPLELGEPAPLFDTRALGAWSAPEDSPFNPLYDPAPAGERFAAVERR